MKHQQYRGLYDEPLWTEQSLRISQRSGVAVSTTVTVELEIE